MRFVPGLVTTKTNRGETVLDTTTGHFWQFNGTGAFILDRVREGLDRPGIARALADTYGLPVERATHDADAFVTDLVRKGLLTDGQG